MKVALWAEIRRLHEIEGLSARAIARRLRCCIKTVAKALTLSAPPAAAAQVKGGAGYGVRLVTAWLRQQAVTQS